MLNETLAAWRTLFAGATDNDRQHASLAHMHPDHIGMSGWDCCADSTALDDRFQNI